MEDSLTVLQGVSELHYHTLPSPLAARRVRPQRDAILRHLSRVPAARFPEFIADLLVAVEGHTFVSVTDGPGDEKQDILTLTPQGDRHLTQCKHTINFERSVAGDELDLMLAACLRKNCRAALYVTNADLTTQAKRYVEDGEYARGWPAGTPPPDIKYWDAERIWSRVSNNASLLSKWFSGMAQAHGLRRFRFDLHISELPVGSTSKLQSDDLAALLGTKAVDNSVTRFHGTTAPDFQWSFSDSIRSNLDLDVVYVGDNERSGILNVPVRTIEVEVSVADHVVKFDPGVFRDRATLTILGVLPTPASGTWWHAVATRPSAFVFLADIDEPKIVRVSTPCTYIRVGGDCSTELDWLLLRNNEYKSAPDAQDDEFRWIHSASETDILIGVEQTRHPLQVHEQQLIVTSRVEIVKAATLFTIEITDSDQIERVRRFARLDWTVMADGTKKVHVAIPQADVGSAPDFLRGVAKFGMSAVATPDEQKAHILQRLLEQSPPMEEFSSFESSLVTPVALDHRIFWLTREVSAPANLFDVPIAAAVLKYKLEYERTHGFDLLEGKDEALISGREVPSLLFSPLVLRGNRMIDIGQSQGRWTIALRIRESTLEPSVKCTERALAELTQIVSDILSLCAPGAGSAGTATSP